MGDVDGSRLSLSRRLLVGCIDGRWMGRDYLATTVLARLSSGTTGWRSCAIGPVADVWVWTAQLFEFRLAFTIRVLIGVATLRGNETNQRKQ